MTTLRHVWVAPPLDGPPTGGTIYNARLLEALARRGVSCGRIAVDDARRHGGIDGNSVLWVDSLHLGAVPELASAHPRVGLVAHYLPSLVEEPELSSREALSEEERAALDAARCVLATSPWFARRLVELGVRRGSVVAVEPGLSPSLPAERREGGPLEVLVVANLLPGKGILPLLEALAPHAEASFRLTLVGSAEHDVRYAAACLEWIRRCVPLASRVRVAGPVPYEELGRWIARADVMASASRMETYGMALAAARAAGLPILARAGGNVAAHVEERAGGELFDDDERLAVAIARLSSDPAELERRRRLAFAGRRERSWDLAAREFIERVELAS